MKNNSAEEIIQGRETLLVEDGILRTDNLRQSCMSRPQLLSVLQSQNIYNIGKIHRVYLEAYGQFSIYR